MSMSDSQDDEQDDVPGGGAPAPAGSSQGFDPRSPVSQFGADAPDQAPGAHAAEGPPDDRPDAVRQRQRDFVPNLLKGLRDKAQSNYPQQEQTQGTSGPREAVTGALQGANANYPENEQQGGGSQLIMRYLAGADADPALAKKAEQSASQQLSQSSDGQPPSESDTRLMALHAAFEEGGPEAAYKVQQTYRASYNAAMGHAHVALNGVPGKPGDLAAAADAATKASTYVLDGTTTQFQPSPDGTGVIKTVMYPGGKQPQSSPLTLEQFNQLTDIGDIKGGQYDAAHETPYQGGPGKPLTPPSQGQQAQGQPNNQPPAGQGMTANSAAVNQAMGKVGLSTRAPLPSQQPQGQPQRPQGPQGDRPFQYAADEGVDPQLAKRSHMLFPSVGQEDQRLQYIDKMTQQGVTNQQNQDKIDTGFAGKQAAANARTQSAGITADARTSVATTQAGAAQNVAQIRGQFLLDSRNIIAASKSAEGAQKMELELHRTAAGIQNSQLKDRVTMAAKMVGSAAMSGQELPPDQAQFVADTMKATQAPPSPQAQTPRAATPQAQQQQAPSPQNQGGGQFTPPAGQGWQFNAAKGQYRDTKGNLYDQNGKPLAQQ